MRKLCLFLCVALFLSTGCQQRSGDAKPNDDSQAKQDEDKKEQKPAEVTIAEVTHAKFLETLKEHKGKVVLVDFWSTNCIPCMEKFPKVVKLNKEHGKDGLVCVSAAIICEKDKALNFLNKQNAAMPNYLVEDEAEAQKHWDFTGIPAYYILDRNGDVLKNGRFSDSVFETVHFEDAEKVALAELAKKK